jgi:capsid protein
VPKAKTGDVALDKIIDAEWPFFADACDTPQRLDFYGMQTLTVRTMAESGEANVRFRPRPSDAGLRVPLQLQMLEADFFDQARTMGLINGHVIKNVQFDELGWRSPIGCSAITRVAC